jgi:hypothetical protein
VVLPDLVELGQALLPSLGRVCAVVDGVDNLSGVLLGVAAAGAVLALLPDHREDRSRPRRS